MIGRRVLLLSAHPDDEVVGCAAAIARARRLGAEVHVAFLTDGVPPASALWPWQRAGRNLRAARRWREADVAAARLGFGIAIRQDIPSRMLKTRLDETRRRLESVTEKLGPDVIWAPAYEGGHQDHDAANFMASLFATCAPVWEYSEYNFARGRVGAQGFPYPNGSETVLDLDEAERAAKRALLDVYKSEKRNLGYVGVAREAFRPLARYDYTKPPHEGRTFYQRFQWVPHHPRVDKTRPQDVCGAIVAFASRNGISLP
jgi:LmbE family N-acetylglucosaminyl deacetylase